MRGSDATLILLLGFFAACWLLIAVYHLGFLGSEPQGPGTLSSALITAYTGAALSIVTVGAVIFAAMFHK